MTGPLTDLQDLLKALNRNRVKYVVIGAHAMSHWGYVRATGDLDVFVVPEEKNALRVWRALSEFGAPMKGTTPDDFKNPGQVVQIGVSPLRVDIINEITGVAAAEVLRKCGRGKLIGVTVRFASLGTLIKNKKALGRPKDLHDVVELAKIKRKRS